MKKLTILLVAFLYVTMMSCKNNEHSQEAHNHTHESAEQSHSHEDEHDHSADKKAEVHEHDSEEHSHENETDPIHDPESNNEEHNHEHEGHSHEYKTAKIELRDFNEIIKVSGEIQTSINNEIVLIATNSGTIHFVNSSAVEGSYISNGQQMFYISGEELVENNISVKYNQTKAAYEKAKSDYERAQQLNQNKIISDKELEKAKSEYLNIKSEYEVISKSYSKGKGTVIAPAKSFVKEFYVEEGQYVDVGDKLACLIRQDKLNLKAEVSQKYLNSLSEIQSATFRIANNNKVYIYSFCINM